MTVKWYRIESNNEDGITVGSDYVMMAQIIGSMLNTGATKVTIEETKPYVYKDEMAENVPVISEPTPVADEYVAPPKSVKLPTYDDKLKED